MRSDRLHNIEQNHLYYQQDLRVPMTYATVVFHGAGFQQEERRLAGIARITARTLFRGTPALTREVISKTVDLLGAAVEASASETDFHVAISCFSRNLKEVLKLVSTVMNEADFPQPELDLVKKQELNLMQAALVDPDRVLSAANEYVLFGRDTMGKFGSAEAVRRITRSDVQQFIEHVRTSSTVYFTAISDRSKQELEELLAVFTSSRVRNGFALKPEVRFRDSRGLEATIINSPGATNDRLIWSHGGIGATDERRFDLSLIVDAFGSFEGYLFDELRNKNGWCYSACVYVMAATTRPGRVAYYSDPSSENSHKLIPEMLRLIEIFPLENGFRERLAERNATFKNRYAYQLDIRKKLTNEVNRDRYGVPILDQQSYNKRIDAVNAATAGKVIEEVFDPKNMTMVFYGDAARLTKILTGIRPPVNLFVLEKEILVE